MDDGRLTILPDQTLASFLPALQARLALVGRSITPQNFPSILDETMKQTLHGAIEVIGGTEGSVWLLDQTSESLTIAYNTGPNSDKLMGQFRQPLRSGLVSMVFSSEQSFVENEVFRNSRQDKTLDSMLKVRTCAMIAVPFYFLEACRGVVSCVQLSQSGVEDNSLPGFNENHESRFRTAARTLQRLIDYWAIRRTIGLD
jgi:hypothetical protein